MEDQFSRQRMLIGEEGMRILNRSRVAVFGLGGVGGYAVEALTRCGIGAIDLVDHDRFSLTNLNRQLHATHSTLGMLKTDAVRNRILEINPDCRVTVYPVFFLPDNAADFNLSLFSYVVDAMDTVTAKLALARSASDAGVAALAARAACRGAELNVRINASGLKDPAPAKPLIARAAEILRDAEALEAQVLEAVNNHINQ